MTTPDEPPVATTVVDATVAIVLAAGAGARFRGAVHKLEARLHGGATVAARSIDTAIDASIGPVVIVTGAVPTIADHVGDRPRVVVVHNPDWADGQMTSLRAGLAAAERLGADAVVVGLADQPFVGAASWRAVAGSTSPIAVATYDGRRGNPVRLHRSVWHLLPPRGDEGARSLIRSHPDLVEPVPCAGSPDDIDTVEDLQRWQNRS